MAISKAEALINQFIASSPQLAIQFLKSERIAIADNASLNEITEKIYSRYYDGDKAYGARLGKFISEGEHVGVVIIDDIIIALVITGVASARAKSKFDRDKRIAENQAQVAKNAALAKTDAQIKAERAKLLAASEAQYREDLKKEAAERRKNAIVYVAAFGVLAILAVIILKKK